VAVALLLGACAMTEDSRTTAFLRDARECELDADAQLKTASQTDEGIRVLLLQSCMALRGWPQPQ
jgi:uncharacterized lipoprotein YmbA